jgi:hypothetical protein
VHLLRVMRREQLGELGAHVLDELDEQAGQDVGG